MGEGATIKLAIAMSFTHSSVGLGSSRLENVPTLPVAW